METTLTTPQVTEPTEQLTVIAQRVAEPQRLRTLPRVIGPLYLSFENTVYNMMGHYCTNYAGGYWEFYTLSNGGFYMAPDQSQPMTIIVDGNGFSGELSADAAGVFITLMALNQFAWRSRDERFADLFYQLHEFALNHTEANAILRAID